MLRSSRVLTRDVRFEGFSTEDWTRFLALFEPRAPVDDEHRPRGGVILVHDGVRIRKALHTHKGRIDVPRSWPLSLEEVCQGFAASWGLAAHVSGLSEVMERLGARMQRSDDLTAQSLLLVNIVREMMHEGLFTSYPMRLRGVPPPTPLMVQRTLDSLCKDGHTIVLGTFHEEALWTAFVLRRKGAGFDVVAGPGQLRAEMGLLSGDWQRDHRHLAHAVEHHYGPLSFGCFAELSVFRKLVAGAEPGGWSRSVLLREVILSPMPAAVGVGLSVDGARFAYERARSLTKRVEALRMFAPLAEAVRARIPGGAAQGISALLGFDPMAALRALLRR